MSHTTSVGAVSSLLGRDQVTRYVLRGENSTYSGVVTGIVASNLPELDSCMAVFVLANSLTTHIKFPSLENTGLYFMFFRPCRAFSGSLGVVITPLSGVTVGGPRKQCKPSRART